MESKKISELEQYNGSADGFMIPGVADGETQKANLGTMVEQKATAAGFLKPDGLKTINGESVAGSGNLDIDMKNPFKGWFDTVAALQAAVASPAVGDYAYIKGATASDPAAIYECATAGTWSDSGRTVDTSNVQTFASGQVVNEVKIMDETGEEVLVPDGVLSATAGKKLGDEVFGYSESSWEEKTLTSYSYYNTHWGEEDKINLTPTSGPTLSDYHTIKLSVHEGDKVRITGLGGTRYTYLYATCESEENNTIIRHATNNQNTRSNPLELTIQEGEGIIVVNMLSYDSSTDKVETYIAQHVPGLAEKVVGIENALNKGIDIVLPDKIYAVVGDTLQVFFRGVVKVKNIDNYDIQVSCLKGSQYRRYYEYTPKVDDIGSTTFEITVRDNNGDEISSKSCELITVASPSTPSTQVNVLCFGDSLTGGGEWPAEACRRLIGTLNTGTPRANGLSNISFCGSKTKDSASYYGAGGWTWGSYISKGARAFRFTVSGVNSVGFRNTYVNNGVTFTVQEVNITNGSGNILCSVSGATDTPTASGILTKTSGSGDATIAFSEATLDAQNPLWDIDNNVFTFQPYVNQYCGDITGEELVVYVLLTWNGLTVYKTDFSAIIAQAKTFANKLHQEYPNAKLKIMGIQMPNQINSFGYGADGKLSSYSYSDAYGLTVTALNMSKAYQDLANEEGYSGFVEYVGVPCQFDSDYNMPTTTKAVNTRNAETEIVASNTVHPANSGYMQIADAVYRNFVANYCQGS